MFEVTLKSNSEFKSELTSVTLFGALVNSTSLCMDSEVVGFIANGDIKLVVSNVYPEGYLPVDNHTLENLKTGARIHYGFDKHSYSRKGNSGEFRVTLNRANNNLWFLVDTDFSKEELTKVIEVAFANGIGAMKSIGKGQFELVSISEFDESKLDCNEANTYITLSDYIPNEDDSTIGNFSTRVIRAKNAEGVEKAPYWCVNAGSRFVGKPDKLVVGKVVKDEATQSLISGQSFIRKIKHGV